MLWVALGLNSKPVDSAALQALQHSTRWPVFRAMAAITAALVFITAMSGAFVAGMRLSSTLSSAANRLSGLDAGLIYNEFPFMGKGLVPEEAYKKEPLWKNFFEDEANVQFNHR